MDTSAPEVVRGLGWRPKRKRFHDKLSNHHYVGRAAFALVFSFLLHISAVTVFKIVVYIPLAQPTYFAMRLVPLESNPIAGTSGTNVVAAGIRLPTLELAQYERLRLSTEALGALDELPMLDDEGEAPDSWARFSGALQEAGESISDFTLSLRSGRAPELDSMSLEALPEPVLRPAPGFELYIEWDREAQRDLVFSPSLNFLWSSDPADLERPMDFIVQVNSSGRVVNAFSPRIDEGELLDAVQRAVLQFRFAPRLGNDSNALDSATVRLRAAEDDAP